MVTNRALSCEKHFSSKVCLHLDVVVMTVDSLAGRIHIEGRHIVTRLCCLEHIGHH